MYCNDLHVSGQDVFNDLLTLVLIRLVPLHAVEHQVVLHRKIYFVINFLP
jgi:hypothetical protein